MNSMATCHCSHNIRIIKPYLSLGHNEDIFRQYLHTLSPSLCMPSEEATSGYYACDQENTAFVFGKKKLVLCMQRVESCLTVACYSLS